MVKLFELLNLDDTLLSKFRKKKKKRDNILILPQNQSWPLLLKRCLWGMTVTCSIAH